MFAPRQLLTLTTSSVVILCSGGICSGGSAIAEELEVASIVGQTQVFAAPFEPSQSHRHIGTVPAAIAPPKAQPETIVLAPTTTTDVEAELAAIVDQSTLAQNSQNLQSVPTIPAEEEPEIEVTPIEAEVNRDNITGTETIVEDSTVEDSTAVVEDVIEEVVERDSASELEVEINTTEAAEIEIEVQKVEVEKVETDERFIEEVVEAEVETETETETAVTLESELETATEIETETETTAIATTSSSQELPNNNIPDELKINQELQNLLDPEEDLDLIPPLEVQSVRADKIVNLTLAEVVELALAENQDLEEAQLNFERAEFQLREAIATEYPTLTNQTDLSFTETAANELAAEAANVDEAESTDSLNNRIELSYNLYTGGQRTGQIGAAETQLEIVELDITRITKETRLAATTTYYDLQSADAQTAIEQAAVADARQSLRDAQLLEQAGLGTKFDVLRAQVEVANAEQRQTLAEANLSTVRRQLAQLINLDDDLDPRAADAIDYAGRWTLSLEESILLAIQQREELRQQLLQREIDIFQEKIAIAALRPQLSVFANYDLLNVFGDGFGPGDGFSFGARMRWNLYDGGAAHARADQEEVDQRIAENRFRNQSDQIRLAVETAYYDLTASDRNITTASTAVTLAEESLRLARLRFKAGVGTQTDVISAQTELTTARNNLEQAITDYNRAYAQLKREVSVGEELEQLSAQ